MQVFEFRAERLLSALSLEVILPLGQRTRLHLAH